MSGPVSGSPPNDSREDSSFSETRANPPAESQPPQRVGRNFLALASGDALARVIAFLASVYVARTLGPDWLGAIAFASAVLLYFQNISECGVDLLGVRHVAEDVQRIRSVAPALLGARVVVASTLALVVLGLGFGAGGVGLLPHVDATVLALYGLTLLPIGPNTKWVHLGLQDTRPVAVARTLGESTYLGLVVLAVHQTADITRVPLFQLCGDALAAAILFLWLRAKGYRIGIEFDWQKVKPIFARSWPLVANVLLGLTIYNSDLIFLRCFRDREAVGRYSAAYQLISFLINVAAAYSLSLLPALTRVAADRVRRNALYHDSAALMFALALPIAIGGSLIAPQIVELVYGGEFATSGPVLAVLLWTLPFTVSKEVDLIALVVGGRERTVMRMTALAVAVNLCLNLLLIPRYGMTGAAWSTLITEAARAVFAAVCARSLEYPLTGIARYWRAAFAGLALAAALYFASPQSLFVALPLGAATYAAALALVGGIGRRGVRL